ncbi:MAG: response regulator [Candidatus Tectomicrobia bacterium]|uniref:Response regulator n=1 Tax=Tectimicrobiota bacterium TaxID=2528274 RepID=A0A938B543_UNCTE|nr:response regulator [Candidatus Tectomicrobia bacterium]
MRRILLIEDDPLARDMLRQMLERAGYKVVEAEDGRTGIQHFQATAIDLIITDILMPDQDGLETIQELRRLDPDAKIIAISGGGQTGLLDLLPIAEKLGAQATLRKPLRRQELLDAVSQLLASPEDMP